MYIDEDILTECLLLEDNNGRIIYDTVEKLATALRVQEIIPVPVMENMKREKRCQYPYPGWYLCKPEGLQCRC